VLVAVWVVVRAGVAVGVREGIRVEVGVAWVKETEYEHTKNKPADIAASNNFFNGGLLTINLVLYGSIEFIVILR
jgi:hypothetical protein